MHQFLAPVAESCMGDVLGSRDSFDNFLGALDLLLEPLELLPLLRIFCCHQLLCMAFWLLALRSLHHKRTVIFVISSILCPLFSYLHLPLSLALSPSKESLL